MVWRVSTCALNLNEWFGRLKVVVQIGKMVHLKVLVYSLHLFKHVTPGPCRLTQLSVFISPGRPV